MLDVLEDIRSAALTLRRSPGFTLAAVAALSLGIAANTAMFSVVNKVLLEPLPYPQPERLVQIISESEVGDQHVVSIPKYLLWRDRTTTFESIAAYDTIGPNAILTDGPVLSSLETARVSADYFRLFGAIFTVGQAFTKEEDESRRARVAVISENLWRQKFKADPRLVGREISIDHEQYRVVGVVSAEFVAEKRVDVWFPLKADLSADDHMSRVRVAARLRESETLRSAAFQLERTRRIFSENHPAFRLLFKEQFTAIPMRDAIVGDVRPALMLLTGAVGFVLLIACANAAMLVLARASRRTAEIAVRSALGARRGQLIQQLLTESMLMALASGVVGLVLGFGGVRALLAVSPAELPRVGAGGSVITLDWRVFLFTFAVSIFSGIVFGLMPAVNASRADLGSLIKDTSVQSGMGFRRGKGRSLLVVSQVALALVLLAGAGVLIRGFAASRVARRGFDEQHVLTAKMALNRPEFERTADVAELVRKVERRLKQIDGISAVAATSSVPLEPAMMIPFTITRHDQSLVGRYHGVVAWHSVSPGYFDALKIRLLGGRFFTHDDNERSAPVVLINRMMMKKYWQDVNANPIGEFIVVGKGFGAGLEDVPRQIAGVVADVHDSALEREPMLYVPVAQQTDAMTARLNGVLPVTWVIRTRDAGLPRAEVERTLEEASGGIPVAAGRTMAELVAVSSARAQFYVLLLSVFSVLSLMLVSVGLYGTMSYSVEQRTREIGVRIALGADPGHIRRLVVWQGLRLALLGIGVGIPAGLVLAQLLVSLVYGVKPADPMVFGGVSVLVAAVAMGAAYGPSARAARVNPVESLRA